MNKKSYVKEYIRKEYIRLFEKIISQIRKRMRDEFVTVITLPSGKRDLKSFVVNVYTGDSEQIVSVTISKDGTILRLHCRGIGGTSLYKFSDYESQDNLVIADPLTFFNLVNRAIDSIVEPCIPNSNKKEDLISAINKWIDPGDCLPFDHRFSRPKISVGLVTEVNQNTVTIGGNCEKVIPLEKLNRRDLKTIICAINNYSVYRRSIS